MARRNPKLSLSNLSLEQVKQTFVTSKRLLILVWNIDPKLFTVSVVAILIPAIVPFINIYIYKLLIDQVVAIVGGAPFNPNLFYPLILIRVLTYFFQDAAFRTQNLVERLLWTKVPIYINQIAFKKVSSLDMYYYENDKFRDLIEKFRESYDNRPQRLVTNLLYSLQSVVQVGIALVALFNLNPFFILLILLVALPEFLLQNQQSKLAYGIWNQESSLRKRFHYLIRMVEAHREHKEVKLFGLADRFLKELKKLQEGFYKNNTALAMRNYKLTLSFNVLSTAVFIGVELYVIFQALARRLTIGDINFYTGVVANFQNGLGGLLRNLNNVFDSALYVASVFEVIDKEPIIKEIENPVVLKLNKAPVIEFENVTFRYPDTNKNILENFSLKINPGEKVAFVGENGAGKSTVIKLLARFYDVDEGQILINGIDIENLSIKDWYKHIGVLFQDFNRYEDTVSENIYSGNVEKEFDLDEVIKASSLAGAHKMVEGLDKKYDQMLGRMFEEGIELSGGQWQKIALARAFFRNAPVLVLDEPTASIDAKAESEIFNRVEKLSRDKTVIIISHRFSTVRNADKIYVIEDGKIVEAGSHHELLKLNKLYAEMFKLQAAGYR
jgi:ATP-binding cassette, subfamily B, bacterial